VIGRKKTSVVDRAPATWTTGDHDLACDGGSWVVRGSGGIGDGAGGRIPAFWQLAKPE
jgi:hypothetical protein